MVCPPPCAPSYALLYDPAGWLQLDPHSGTVRTKRELRHPSAFLQGGWYIALVLARDDGEHPAPPKPPRAPRHPLTPLLLAPAQPSPRCLPPARSPSRSWR